MVKTAYERRISDWSSDVCSSDLMQGPKLRIGNLKDGEVMLQAGQRFRLDLDEAPGDDQRAPLPHPEIFAALSAGTSLLIDDGKLRLEVQDCTSSHAETRVITGGPLRNHKGVNLPGVILPISPITEKDRIDLAFALDLRSEEHTSEL